MRKLALTIAAILGCSLIACVDDGYYIKVFSCPDEKPFFNTVDNRCYSSEAAAEEVNKLIQSGKEQDKINPAPVDPVDPEPEDPVDPIEPEPEDPIETPDPIEPQPN